MDKPSEKVRSNVFATVPAAQRDEGKRGTVPFILWQHKACLQAIALLGAPAERVRAVAKEKASAYWSAGESISGAADMFAAFAKGAAKAERAEQDASIGETLRACRAVLRKNRAPGDF